MRRRELFLPIVSAVVSPFLMAVSSDGGIGRWEAVSPSPFCRTFYTPSNGTVLSDGRAVVAGWGTPLEVYDPVTDKWATVTGQPPIWFRPLFVSLTDGRVIVFDRGEKSEEDGQTVAMFDPEILETRVLNLPIGNRIEHAVSIANGEFLVARKGKTGYEFQIFVPSSESFEPAAQPIRTGDGEEQAVIGVLAGLKNGKVMLTGLVAPGRVANAAIYDPFLDTWEPAATPKYAYSGRSSVLMDDGDLLVTGGVDPDSDTGEPNRPDTVVELYLADQGQWLEMQRMNKGRFLHSSVKLDDGRVLVAGSISNFGFESTVEIYDQIPNRWDFSSEPCDIRYGPAVAKLGDGRVLFAGGSNYLSAEVFISWDSNPSSCEVDATSCGAAADGGNETDDGVDGEIGVQDAGMDADIAGQDADVADEQTRERESGKAGGCNCAVLGVD